MLRKVRKGTRVLYLPGNHDEMLRDFTRLQFGGIDVVEEAIHVTADGRRLLVIHGDVFDAVVKHARWLALLGDSAYTAALWLNHHFNVARRRLGYPYWSLSAYLKGRVKNAVQYIGAFANAVADEARRRGLDGVVCGHIHQAEIRDIDGVLYCNDGDWVESCTALVEHVDGRLEIVRWIERRSFDPLDADRRLPAAPPAETPALAGASS
jgi:UDP-2,3-diacylglucosamine pyrophosphatase LpxH